jgi:methyl coenzyme M reductase subunit C-like uncharacterized protein (methanogenesis marker protein 7)
MSIAKEQYSDYIERIEDAVDIYVDQMTVRELLEYTAQNMKDYFVNKASSEEIKQLLDDNEPL